MKYLFSSVTHFQSDFIRSSANGSLMLLLTTIILGACTQAELRGEGREEAIYPGESVAGRTIPYVPDPDSVLLPEDFAYSDEEAVFPGESVTGRTIPYSPDTVPPPENFGTFEEETISPRESIAVGTIPDDPEPGPDELAETDLPEIQEITPDASAELPKIPETAVVAVQTTTQEISHAVLEEQIAPEKVLFPDAEGEITSDEEMAVAVEEETVSEEELIDVIQEGDKDVAALNATDIEEKMVDSTKEGEDITPVVVEEEADMEEDIAFLVEEEEAVSEGETISAIETTVETVEKGVLPENVPFTVVALTPSEQPSLSNHRNAASNGILVADEEQTGFASEEMFVAVNETTIPGASISATLADAAVSTELTSSAQTDEKITSVLVTVERPKNAPGSSFGKALAFGGGLGEAAKGSTYPSKKGGSGRYDPAPDPDDPPQGIFGTKGISLFSNSSRRSESEGNSNLSINSFLWRATLETLSFMPLDSADPFGGVIITDWHINPESAGERFKVVAYILDSSLRVGALRISVFRQQKDSSGAWLDAVADENVHVQLETAILNRARELRLSWIEEQEG